jgi:hypothetical protein
VTYHLLTVDHCHETGFGIQFAPMVRYGRLIADFPANARMLQDGDPVELRILGGQVAAAVVSNWGLEGYRDGDDVLLVCDPADPEFTLSVKGNGLDDVPVGTEVWLPGVDAAPSPPEARECGYCKVLAVQEGRATILSRPPEASRDHVR